MKASTPFILAACAWTGLANTEIVNFEVGHTDVLSSSHWPKLNSTLPYGQWTVMPTLVNGTPIECGHDMSCDGCLGVVLDLSDPRWKAKRKFTLRASWPGSSPVDVSLRIHSPSHSVPPSPTEYEMIPRAVYACIILRHSGPQTPFGASALHDAVPFRLELEPLVLGAVPPSVIPIVAASLTTVVGVAHLLYPWLQAAIARGSLEGQDRKSS